MMSNYYKLVILDFDGTLGNTNAIITSTMQATLQKLGLPMKSAEACSRTIGLPLAGCFKALIDMDDELAEKCANTYRALFDDNSKTMKVEPFRNVLTTLRNLHGKGILLSIASSRGHQSLMDFVHSFQLTPYISFVLGGDDVNKAKPDAEPVVKTLNHFALTPAEALVVGDMHYDILMGRNAGCTTCGVTYGNGSEGELRHAGADYIIDDFSELEALV